MCNDLYTCRCGSGISAKDAMDIYYLEGSSEKFKRYANASGLVLENGHPVQSKAPTLYESLIIFIGFPIITAIFFGILISSQILGPYVFFSLLAFFYVGLGCLLLLIMKYERIGEK